MGDKHGNKNKHGKKITTKEKKAMNHLKLMQGSKDHGIATTASTSNVVDINQNKDKKAA
jgi:hypothetical protein